MDICDIPYSGYFSGGKIFVHLKILAHSWEKIRGVDHTVEVKMADFFEVDAMVRGYHQYREIWGAEVGEQLECRRENSNPHDIFDVAVLFSNYAILRSTLTDHSLLFGGVLPIWGSLSTVCCGRYYRAYFYIGCCNGRRWYHLC